eukprot:CAMPEP_0179141404 /NCGR_PEP_ID=MMETSP0796-20121207/67814_1 /TAXON_ID=73915 /ORGANISM="Pyrodinium bahamense, Strain pbaha01" /LENGTH=425 /DNA_ID=CAMNT_0020841117 /DNA_START=36 /DNA_END=1313 /DNA_ORIENTATION=+
MPQVGRLLLAAAGLLAVRQSQGDLGAALRRQAHSEGPTAAPSGAQPPSGPLVVRLERADARPVAGQARHTKDSFYVGNITVGHPPQRLQVLFDTASGHVLLPHRACKSPACLEHRCYSPWESSTAADVNPNGEAVQRGARLARGLVNRTVVTVGFTQADLGHGDAKGVLVRDNVCLSAGGDGGRACANMAVLAAMSLDDEPFRGMPHDGILGLALEGLAAGALGSFYERLMDGSHELLPHFGMLMGPTNGEITFGGHDHTRLAAPLRWFPVTKPEEGFWQVRIHAVHVGDLLVDSCLSGCRGIIDSGSSSLGVQEDGLQRLLPVLKAQPSASGPCSGPDLRLDLGSFLLVLKAEDYTGTSCEPELGLLDLDPKEYAGVYALGTAVLHRYYTAFDWASARVGLAPLAVPSRAVTEPSAGPAEEIVV